MAVSRRVVLLLLAGLILLGFALRYPMVPHERFQTDSYFIHYLSQSIVDNRMAIWTFSPLSYFGYYPMSYPTGVPFLISELANLADINVELAIYFANLLFSVLFCLTVFGLAREFTHRPEFVLLATFFAAVAPRFVDTTYWDGSARGPAIVMISLLVFIAYRAGFTHQSKLYLPVLLVGVGCFVIHHMAVLVVVFGFAHILATLGARFTQRIPVAKGRRLPILLSAVVLLTLSLLVMGYFGILGSLFISTFGDSSHSAGVPRFLSLLMNISISYVHQIGFVLVIAIIGAVAMLRKPHFEVKSLFPLAVLVTFIPLLGNSIYVSMLLAPFVAVVAVGWLGGFLRHRHRHKPLRLGSPLTVGFVALLAVTVALPVWSVDTWNSQGYITGDTVEIGNQVFNDAAYLNTVASDHNSVCNNEGLTLQLQALTSAKLLRSGLSSVVNGDVTKQDVLRNMTRSEVTFPGNLYVWFQYKEEYFVDGFVMSLMRTGTPALHQTSAKVVGYAASHSNLIVVVDNDWPDEYVTSYGVFNATFLSEIRTGTSAESGQGALPSFIVYQSEGQSTYMVDISR